MQTHTMAWCSCMNAHTYPPRLAAVQDARWSKILSPRLTSSSMQSHKCHTALLGGTTNINMGKMREKKLCSLPFSLFPSANRLVPNPPGIRGDELFLIGYIEINKHMSVSDGSTLQKAIFIKSFFLMFSLKILFFLFFFLFF